jgi:4-hydroxy-2-oxoheptanedioate aldolase
MNTLKNRLSQRSPTRGCFLVLPDEEIAAVAACAGFDYVVVDCQHGLFGHDTMRRMVATLAGSDTASIVRVPPADDYAIGRALDAGADGLLVPLVNDAADVARAIRAAEYPPLGARSFGPMRQLVREGMGYLPRARRAHWMMPQIETAAAVEHIEEIVALDGVDAVYVGPFDLALALGAEPGMDPPGDVFEAAMQRIVAACDEAGVVPACHADRHTAGKRLRQGFRMLTVATDIALVRDGFADCLAALPA